MSGILSVLLGDHAAAGGGGGGSSATWDVATAVSPIALSNGNLTASITLPDSNNYTVLATAGVAAGELKYWEMAGDTIDSSSNAIGFGLANDVFSSGSSVYLGSTGNSLAYYNSGDVYYNSSLATSYAAYSTNGDRISLAVDLVNNKLWVRVNGGNWNNDVIGNQNPAVGSQVGGYTINTIMSPDHDPLLPALIFRGNTSGVYQATAKFSSSSWTYSAPSGFSQID